MRRLQFLVSMLLCCGLAVGIGLVACGNEEVCEDICTRFEQCDPGGSRSECLDECNDVDDSCYDCASNCLAVPCFLFEPCLEACCP